MGLLSALAWRNSMCLQNVNRHFSHRCIVQQRYFDARIFPSRTTQRGSWPKWVGVRSERLEITGVEQCLLGQHYNTLRNHKNQCIVRKRQGDIKWINSILTSWLLAFNLSSWIRSGLKRGPSALKFAEFELFRRSKRTKLSIRVSRNDDDVDGASNEFAWTSAIERRSLKKYFVWMIWISA